MLGRPVSLFFVLFALEPVLQAVEGLLLEVEELGDELLLGFEFLVERGVGVGGGLELEVKV